MLFRIRFLALFAILSLTDTIMLAVAIESIMMHGVGAIVLFGNEASLQFIMWVVSDITPAIVCDHAGECCKLSRKVCGI
jgi:hypothetical protein